MSFLGGFVQGFAGAANESMKQNREANIKRQMEMDKYRLATLMPSLTDIRKNRKAYKQKLQKQLDFRNSIIAETGNEYGVDQMLKGADFDELQKNWLDPDKQLDLRRQIAGYQQPEGKKPYVSTLLQQYQQQENQYAAEEAATAGQINQITQPQRTPGILEQLGVTGGPPQQEPTVPFTSPAEQIQAPAPVGFAPTPPQLGVVDAQTLDRFDQQFFSTLEGFQRDQNGAYTYVGIEGGRISALGMNADEYRVRVQAAQVDGKRLLEQINMVGGWLNQRPNVAKRMGVMSTSQLATPEEIALFVSTQHGLVPPEKVMNYLGKKDDKYLYDLSNRINYLEKISGEFDAFQRDANAAFTDELAAANPSPNEPQEGEGKFTPSRTPVQEHLAPPEDFQKIQEAKERIKDPDANFVPFDELAEGYREAGEEAANEKMAKNFINSISQQNVKETGPLLQQLEQARPEAAQYVADKILQNQDPQNIWEDYKRAEANPEYMSRIQEVNPLYAYALQKQGQIIRESTDHVMGILSEIDSPENWDRHKDTLKRLLEYTGDMAPFIVDEILRQGGGGAGRDVTDRIVE